MRVLESFGWVLVYFLVVPITLLLLVSCFVSDRDPGIGFAFSPRMGLRLLTAFYGCFITPLLLGVAAVTVPVIAAVPWFRSVAAPGLAGLASVVAAVVVFIGWAIRYPDQRQRFFRTLRRFPFRPGHFGSWLHGG